MAESHQESNHPIIVTRAKLQFVFPFMLVDDKIEDFTEKLLAEKFDFFDLKNREQEDLYYGGCKVHHRSLSSFFLPNIEAVLFPESYKLKESFRRFTKKMDLKCGFFSNHLDTDFVIDSLDIMICPFHIGLMNIRVSLPENLNYSEVLFFGDTFRVLEPIADEAENTNIKCRDASYKHVKTFIFNELLRPLKTFIRENKGNSSYFGSLPFFIDERMYVIGHIAVNEESEMTKVDLFRAGQLNGYDQEGKPYIGAKNPDYINRYYQERVYDRWGKETYYVTSESHFVCITKASEKCEIELMSQMYGQHYYSLMLYFYYKIVLLKLTHEHSNIDIEKDQSSTELLIIMITNFSAKFFFPEVNSTTTGKEIFGMVKETFRIDKLYENVKETLTYLYQNQEKLSAKRHDYLLQILTIYTVISGIFGMNLVIEDGKKAITWSTIAHYSVYEFFTLFVIVTGVMMSVMLGSFFVKNWIRQHRSRKRQIY